MSVTVAGSAAGANSCQRKFVVSRAGGGYDAQILDLHRKFQMKFRRGSLAFAAQLCLAGAVHLTAQTSPLLPSQKAPLSNPVVPYQIDAKYNPNNHSLHAQHTLPCTNYPYLPH